MNLPRLCRLAAAFASAGFCLAAGAQNAAGTPQHLPVTTLHAGMFNIQAQVARSPAERQTGLMYRTSMAPHEGMLFVFEQAEPQCFWMRNTLLPLSIAFLADDGSIVNVDEMAPQTDTTHCSDKPVRYVLEMNQGWFSKRGLARGAKLRGGPFGE